MPALNSKLAIEKLDNIYFCAQSEPVFLKSDAEDHMEMAGEIDIKVQPFRQRLRA